MFKVILLCLLSCCSSFIPLKHSESIIIEDHTQVVEKKTKQNFVKTASGYYEYGLTDLYSYDFATAVINYFGVNLGNSDLLISSDNTGQYVLQTSNTYSVYWFDNTNHEYDFAFNVSNIILQKEYWNSSFRKTFTYHLIFSNSSPYDKQISIDYYTQRSNDNQLTILGVYLNAIGLSSFGGLNTWFTRFMLSEDSSSRTAFIYDLMNKAHSDNYNAGYANGYDDGYSVGYNDGDEVGYDTGYSVGQTAGYTTGYNTGVSDTIASGSEAMTIFAGIMDVAFIPVNVFFLMFNYEVFGINIAGFVSGLLTIAIVIILMRFIIGRKV